MGRIAEALKRAQDERARRKERESATVVAEMPVTSAAARLDQAVDAGDVLQASIVEPPAIPRPFVIHSEPILAQTVDPRVLALHDAASPIAERYRSVRTRLLTANPDGSARVLAVTSGLPKEGKSVTVANLGFSLAELRHLRVAIVDLDFRRRGLSTMLGAKDAPGMAEVLRGDRTLAEVCRETVRPNLYFVPAGQPQEASPSELLAGARAAAAFRELGERFHHTLVDTPPMDTVADVGLIAPLCHSVLVVVRMNSTPEPVVRRCVRMLQANGVPITGCVLAGYDEASGSRGRYTAEKRG